MKFTEIFTGTGASGTRHYAVGAMLVLVAALVVMLMLGGAVDVFAVEHQTEQTEPATPALTAQLEAVLERNKELEQIAEAALQEQAAAEAERDEAFALLADSKAENEILRQEREILRQKCTYRYMMRFKLIRTNTLLNSTEIVYVTIPADEEKYNRWQDGDLIPAYNGIISLPGETDMVVWEIVLDHKYIEISEVDFGTEP